MANRTISDLVGTLRTFFKVGTVRLKDATGVLQVRNSGDTAFADVSASKLLVNGTGAITIQSSTGAWTLTLPVDDGTSHQLLETDGAGVTSWTSSHSRIFQHMGA